jgi:UTP--glucose-1-phosphate uridylyltransferase
MKDSYDRQRFERLVADLRSGALAESSQLEGDGAQPVGPGEVPTLPQHGNPLYAACRELGSSLLARGEVAAVILAGGAGTRFGGQVKALVSVLGDRTFLDFKLEDVRLVGEEFGARLPVGLMVSDLTEDPIRLHLAQIWANEPVRLFRQQSLPRVDLSGEIALDEQGRPSLSPAGHGDFYAALKRTGLGQELYSRGIRHLLFSNVDNLAATVDPVVLGYHASHCAEMTLEVTDRAAPEGGLDEGGAPVRVHGRLVLKEKVRSAQHALLSTNNFTFELRAILEKEIALPWRVVRKKAIGKDVLQFETVSGEATGLVDGRGNPIIKTEFVRVPRADPMSSRFEPVKTPPHLARAVERLRPRLTKLAASMET